MTRATTDPAAKGALPPYGVVLFDFDGTVADTVPLIMESFQYVFVTLTGAKADESFLLSTIGEPLERTFRILDSRLRDEAMRLYFRYNESIVGTRVGIFIEACQMLKDLRKIGTCTAIVTSKRLSVMSVTIEQFGLSPYFDIVVTRENTTRHKPFPDPIFKALELLQEKNHFREPIRKSDVLFVGDSVHDLRCANNAGVDIAIVDWTYMDKQELRGSRPDHWIFRAGDITRLCGPYGGN